MSTLAEQERKLLELLTHSVHRTFADARVHGVPAEVFADIEAIAASMTSALPTGHIYDQLVGPFYNTSGLTQWWGVSRQAVAKAASTRAVIACQLDGGRWVYPTWQFSDSGTVYPDLLTLWSTLCAEADAWTCATWLRSPLAVLDDRSSVQWVAEGRSIEPVLELARAAARRWAA